MLLTFGTRGGYESYMGGVKVAKSWRESGEGENQYWFDKLGKLVGMSVIWASLSARP